MRISVKIISLLLSAVGVICVFDSFYVIGYDQQGLIVRLGKIVSKEPLSPGLGVKQPFLQKVIKLERRVVDLATDSREVIAADQKRLIVNYYIKYRILDPILFYESTRSETVLETRIRPIVESQVREKIGRVPLLGILSEDRASVMDQVREGANSQARMLGVSIVDVRIKRTDLPEENSEAVFKRMQTDRSKEAKEIRAQGFESAQKIRALADREHGFIIAEAHKKQQIVVGEGESEAARILNESFGVDREFFNWYKTLELYKNSFKGDNTKVVLSGKDRVLDYFYNGVRK